MANGHGGSRTPSNPASVSGPGSLSQRTDGKQPVRDLTGQSYGQGQDFHDLQSSASMESAAPANPTPNLAGTSAPSVPPPTPLSAPTERPGEPVSAGAPWGAGPGPEAVAQSPDQHAELRKMLPTLIKMADLPTTSDESRRVIRYLRGIL